MLKYQSNTYKPEKIAQRRHRLCRDRVLVPERLTRQQPTLRPSKSILARKGFTHCPWWFVAKRLQIGHPDGHAWAAVWWPGIGRQIGELVRNNMSQRTCDPSRATDAQWASRQAMAESGWKFVQLEWQQLSISEPIYPHFWSLVFPCRLYLKYQANYLVCICLTFLKSTKNCFCFTLSCQLVLRKP